MKFSTQALAYLVALSITPIFAKSVRGLVANNKERELPAADKVDVCKNGKVISVNENALEGLVNAGGAVCSAEETCSPSGCECVAISTFADLESEVLAASEDAANPSNVILCPGTIEMEGSIPVEGKFFSVMCAGEGCILEGIVEDKRFFDVSGASDIKMEGITVQNAGSVNVSIGGAFLVNETSALAFDNCTFSSNEAARGGVVYIQDGSTASFTDCLFADNSASVHGGGVYAKNSVGLSFTHCEFVRNNATQIGSAVFCTNDTASAFTGCTFRNNNAGSTGTVFQQGYPTACNSTIIDSSFEDNSAGSGGGAFYGAFSGFLFVERSNFTGNSLLSQDFAFGGAVALNALTLATFKSCSFTGNSAPYAGAIRLLQRGIETVFDSCMFMGNRATKKGGVMKVFSVGTQTITNSVFFNNTAVEAGDDIDTESDTGESDSGAYVCQSATNKFCSGFGSNAPSNLCGDEGVSGSADYGTCSF